MRKIRLVRGAFNLTLVIAAVSLLPRVTLAPELQMTPGWSYTRSLNTARSLHTATLLLSGKVLVAGGWGRQAVLGSAELYDPASGTWTRTGSLQAARYGHTATLMADGKVLVVGGITNNSQPPDWVATKTAELYDPETGQWMFVGNLSSEALNHTATLLLDGKVLVAGGSSRNWSEIYDPKTQEWRRADPTISPRQRHTATMLGNGKILVAGGIDSLRALSSAEIFDPIEKKWAGTGNLNTPRSGHTATLFPGGRVLVAGGSATSWELYDPVTGSWSSSGTVFAQECNETTVTATLLADGKVLFAGCFNYDEGYVPSTILYDPETDDRTWAGNLNTPRSEHTATLLPDGRVLVAGGSNYDIPLESAELYSPAPGRSTLFVPIILSSAGANASFYTSELTLANHSIRDLTVEFTYTSASGGGMGSAIRTLEAGQQQIAADALSYLRQLGIPISLPGEAGTLRLRFSGISSLGDVAALARTTTLVADGRVGLAYPGIASHALMVGAAYLCGLRQNASDRSNVALQNAGEQRQGNLALRLTVYSGEAATPISMILPDIVIPPGGFRQINSILSSNGLSLTNGYVRIERVSGTAPYYAYAVINDNSGSDGSFVLPLPESLLAARNKLTLPVAVEANGFTTELVATNWSEIEKTLRCTYVADAIEVPNSTATFSIGLNPHEQLILPDFVQYLRALGIFGIGPSGPSFAGAIFAEVTGSSLEGISLAARTSVAGKRGRYGLFYAAVPNGMASTMSTWVYGLQQTSETRSNLALVNTGETDDSVDTFRIELFDGETHTIASSLETSVKAKGWKQLGTVLAQHAPGTTQGYARVTRIAGKNPFIAYAVLNDGGQPGQGTGDGAFVGGIP